MWILCLAEDSLETPSLISLKNSEIYLWMSSAAVVIGTLRVKIFTIEQKLAGPLNNLDRKSPKEHSFQFFIDPINP